MATRAGPPSKPCATRATSPLSTVGGTGPGICPIGTGERTVPGQTRNGLARERRAAFHQDDIAPAPALPPQLLPAPDEPEPTALVQFDRRFVRGEDPRLDRPDLGRVGLL